MRSLILLLLLLLADLASASPNVVIVMADDLGYSLTAVSRELEVFSVAPSIESIAANGVSLEHFYVQPICTPTRAALHTGETPTPEAWRVPGIDVPEAGGLDPGVPTLPARFANAGYFTGLVGKWHLGPGADQHPNAMGYDDFFGMIGAWINYWTKRSPEGIDWQRNGSPEPVDETYATHALGAEAVDFVSTAPEPFFLVASFNAPHFPMQAPQETVDWYEQNTFCAFGQPTLARCTYLAMVEELDEQVGEVLAALQARGVSDDTIVLFFSDNGGHVALGGNNDPLREGKLGTYQGGIRVRAALSWPNGLAPGRAVNARMRVQDVWATLEEAAGLRPQAPPGSESLWREIRAPKRLRRRKPMVFFNQIDATWSTCLDCWRPEVFDRSIILWPWKLVTHTPAGYNRRPSRVLQTTELYNLKFDPAEELDLSARYPRRHDRLLALLDETETLDYPSATSAFPPGEIEVPAECRYVD